MAKKDGAESVIETLAEKLKSENTFFSDNCKETLINILKNKKAAQSFADRITKYLPYFRENPTQYLNNGTIFEIPKLSKDQKKNKKGKSDICCYKDRKSGKNTNNIRCIFIMEENKIVFLVAFVEKDKKDYSKPLDNVVQMYNDIIEEN